MVVRMDHCRTKFYINYFISEDKNDDRILDIESPIGDMDLYHSSNITGGNLDNYIKDMNKLCVHIPGAIVSLASSSLASELTLLYFPSNLFLFSSKSSSKEISRQIF